MPTNIKLLLSILVVVVSGTMFHVQRDLENIMPSYASLFVGVLMILGIFDKLPSIDVLKPIAIDKT